MKYKNMTTYVLIAKELTINPGEVTADLSDKQIDENEELKNFISKGYLKKFEVKEVKKAAPKTDVQDKRFSGEIDNKTVIKTQDGVIYTVNDSPNTDLATPFSKTTSEIFPDVTDVSDKIEDMLNKESEDNDPDTNMADFEERSVELDEAKDFTESEYSTIITNAKKNGANIITTKDMAVSMDKVADAVKSEISKTADDGEKYTGEDNQLADFLSKPFFTKKKEISTIEDVNFLNKVREVTNSNNIRKIVEHRLRELSDNKK